MYGETLAPFVTKYNLLNRGTAIQAPKNLIGASNVAIVEYLRSLFQAEGYVALSAKSKSSHVGFAVVSRSLARDVQRLLLCLESTADSVWRRRRDLIAMTSWRS